MSQSENECEKRRYVICGLSTRSVVHFLLPVLGVPSEFSKRDYSGVGEIVGIMELDPERVSAMNAKLGRNIPCYRPDEFSKMVRETRPDCALVGSRDCDHAGHILEALAHDLDVVVEKPMVISSDESRAVLAAEKKSKGRVQVAFNMRYNPRLIAAKRFIASGGLGTITSASADISVNTKHGASYFYRWNRERKFSGGLSIHKETHQFDIISWLIGDRAESLFAFGKLNYYGKDGLLRPRDAAGKPLSPEEEKKNCPYFQRHLTEKFSPSENPATKWDPLDLPYNLQYPESRKRYIYDDEIDIEDTYSAVVRYRSGASLSFGCNFSAPFSGHRYAFNGSKGRLEINGVGTAYARQEDLVAWPTYQEMVFYPLFGGREEIKVEIASRGAHAGGDELNQEDAFNGGKNNPPYMKDLKCFSGALDGAYAVAMGEAAWRSAADFRPYTMKELLGEYCEG